jgi:hypothetical protein
MYERARMTRVSEVARECLVMGGVETRVRAVVGHEM